MSRSAITLEAPAAHPIATVTLTEDGPATVRWRDGRVQRFDFESEVYQFVRAEELAQWFEERESWAWVVPLCPLS